MAMKFPINFDVEILLLPLFSLFKNSNVAFSFALGMLLCAAGFWLWFRFRHISPVLGTLERMRKQLLAIPDHEAFYRKFEDFSQAISSEPLLKHGWEEFRETLILPEANSPQLIQNTARPYSYFNIDSVTGPLKLSFYQSLPNNFVGVGLLFTFLGLVAALYFASKGVAGDVQQAKDSLSNLLTAATFKFSTSIAGLLSSILLSLSIKRRTRKVQSSFDSLCELLEQRMMFVTTEWLTLQQVGELKKQTLQLERFNTDFAVEVASALERGLNASLGPVIGSAIKPMAEAIDDMAKNFGNVNQDAMQQMVGEFKNSIQGAAGTEMNALAQTLATLQQSLNGMIGGMGQTGTDFGNRIELAAERMENLLGGVARTMETSVAESASRLEKILEGASHSLRSDTEQISSELGKAIMGIVSEFQSGIVNATTHWNNGLSASSDGIKTALDLAGETLAVRVEDATQRFNDVVIPFSAQFKGMESTLYALDGRMKTQLSGFDTLVTRFGEAIAGIDQSLIRLREAGDPVASTAKLLGEAALNIEIASKTVQNTNEQLTETAKAVRDGAEMVQRSWDSYRQRFEKVDEDLIKVFGEFQKGTEAYHLRVNEYVTQMDNHFTVAMNSLGGGIKELTDVVEELSETMAKQPVK